MLLHLICWCLAPFNVVVAGLSIQSLQPMTAEAPLTWSTTPAVCKTRTPKFIPHPTKLSFMRNAVPEPSSIYFFQNLVIASAHKVQIWSSSPTPLNGFTHQVIFSSSVPASGQPAAPLASETQPHADPTVPTQEATGETGGTQLPALSLIPTGVYQVHHDNTGGTGATIIGPAPTYDSLQTRSTAFGHLRQPTQISQSLSLCTSTSSLAFGDVVQNIITFSVSQLALGSQSIIQPLRAGGLASPSWRVTESTPYKEYGQTNNPKADQVATSQGMPYGSNKRVTTTGKTMAQGTDIPISQSKENLDSSLSSARRSVSYILATSTMHRTEHLTIELGAHSRSAAESSQAFELQSPSGRKHPSSTEHVDVTAGTLVGHGGPSMTFTPTPSIVGQSRVNPFVNLSLLETGSGSFQITPPAANADLFLQDRVIFSKSSAALVGTVTAEYSISITAYADKAALTDFFVQQGQAFLTTPQVQSLQRLTTAHTQQPHITATAATHTSYSESRNSSASDQLGGRMSGRAIGVMVGAVAGGTSCFLAIFAIAVRHRKRKRRKIWISNQFWNDPNRSYISFGST